MRTSKQSPTKSWARRAVLQQLVGIGLLILALTAGPLAGNFAWAQEKQAVTLFFPRADRPLMAKEVREIEVVPSVGGQIKRVLASLFDGPFDRTTPAFFTLIQVRQAFLDQTGTAFVDLTLADRPSPGVSVMEEWLGLWAIVNTLCYNFKDIHRVKFLVAGGEAQTLLGHLDISRPLRPDQTLIDETKTGQLEENGRR